MLKTFLLILTAADVKLLSGDDAIKMIQTLIDFAFVLRVRLGMRIVQLLQAPMMVILTRKMRTKTTKTTRMVTCTPTFQV